MNDSVYTAVREILETRLTMVRQGQDPGPLHDLTRQRLQELNRPELAKMHYECEALLYGADKTKQPRRSGRVPDTVRQVLDQARKHSLNVFFRGTTYTPDQFENALNKGAKPDFWPQLRARTMKQQRAIEFYHERVKEAHEGVLEEELTRIWNLTPTDEKES